jgi:hypothetical protein
LIRTVVTIRVGTKFILGMELRAHGCGRSSNNGYSRCSVGDRFNSWGGSDSYRSNFSGDRGSGSDSYGSSVVIAVVDSIGQVGVGNLGIHSRGSGNLNGWGSSSNGDSGLSSNSCSSINMVNRKVGGANTETKSIGNVVYILHNTVTVHIAVGPADNTISSLDLLLARVTISVSEAVLTNVILAVILIAGGLRGNNDRVGRSNSHWSDRCNGDGRGVDASMDSGGNSSINRGASRVHVGSSIVLCNSFSSLGSFRI